MKRFLVAAVVAVALFVSQVALASQVFLTYPRINDTASWLAMRKVEVRCLTEEEAQEDTNISLGADAYVEGWIDDQHHLWHPGKTAVFKPGICELLTEVDLRMSMRAEIAWAILVLTHEAGHLRGHRWSAFENTTQCWAMRHFGYTAQRLGYTDREVLRQLKDYAMHWHIRMPEAYRMQGCKLPGFSN